jgi:hypothetical protein
LRPARISLPTLRLDFAMDVKAIRQCRIACIGLGIRIEGVTTCLKGATQLIESQGFESQA